MAKLYFYYSTMNAGKSTSLLQSSHNYRERGMRTLVYTAQFDQRGGGKVHSRIGLSSEALHFGPGSDLFAEIDGENRATPCQLRPTRRSAVPDARSSRTARNFVDHLSIPVLCYGLRTDFRGELFPGSARLLALADELTELKTICHCGRKATMVVRVGADGRPSGKGSRSRSAATSAMSRSAGGTTSKRAGGGVRPDDGDRPKVAASRSCAVLRSRWPTRRPRNRPAAAATSSRTAETALHDCGGETPIETEGLDTMRAGLERGVCSTARFVDGLFGGDREFAEYDDEASGRASVTVGWNEQDGVEVDTRFRASVNLPQINERFNATIGKASSDEYIADEIGVFNPAVGAFSDDDPAEWFAGVGYRAHRTGTADSTSAPA